MMNSKEQKMVNGCKNLEQLRDLLNKFDGMSLDGKYKITDVVDFASLPLFSEKAPKNTSEVWSYDDTRFLTDDDGNNQWGIKDRCPDCDEASFHCECE